MATDVTLYLYKEGLDSIHELEPLTSFTSRREGSPGGMLLEVGSSTFVPRGWTKIWPIGVWQNLGPAASRVGGTDPEIMSTVYLEYIGEEQHTVGTPPAELQASAFVYIQAAGKAPMGDATETLSGMVCMVSYDFGESWHNFFQIGEFKLNGVLTDRLAQVLVVAATRLGMRSSPGTENLPLHSRLVFDNTFFTEYHQLWLEDENERVRSRGGVGVKPVFEDAVVADPSHRLAVHSGTWGVIRKKDTIVAATFCPVNWCQNSDAIKIPVLESPFCYSVNFPKDILWIGPAMYINSYNDPSINQYFQGAPQEDAITKWETNTGYWGEPGEFHWRSDGMRKSGAKAGLTDWVYFDGWDQGLSYVYWDPDYRFYHTNYSYPYTSYWKPTGTTVILLKQNKTAGDVPVSTPQWPGGNDAITTGHPFMQDRVYFSTGGVGGGQYGYSLEGEVIPDPYGTSLWTFAHFKKHMLKLRPYAIEVAKKIISEWDGIVRNVVRNPAERSYWDNTPSEIKNRDMCQMGCLVVGEYEINGRYNNMTRALFAEFTYYSASFLKFFVAEQGAGGTEESGNIIFELFDSAISPGQYAASILPSKSFGNVVYGIKSYYEKTHTIERRQCLNYTNPNNVFTYNQEQYGMVKYTPVVSEDGGVTWHNVTGLTRWDNTTSRVQFKPIWIGQNQWICEHDAKLYKSFTGIGWSPIEYAPDEEWSKKLDPSLEEAKTYLVDVPCRNEWLVVHQYENQPTGVVREAATVLDKNTLRTTRQVVSVDGVYALYNGFEREYPVKEIKEQTLIVLSEALDTEKVRDPITKKVNEVLRQGLEVYVSYQTKPNVARLFHVVSDPATSNLSYIIKDLSFIGDEWFPKQNTNLQSPYDPTQGYKCAINTLSGGLLPHLYYRDPVISAYNNLFPSDWQPLQFKTTELPELIVDYPFLASLEVEGGTGIYKYTKLAAPAGLILDRESGEISGIVNVGADDFSVSVVADDSSTPAYVDPTEPPASSDTEPPLYGYVYNSAGAAVADATVSVVNPQTGVVEATTTTDSHGRYTINVPANVPKVLRMGKGECVGSDLVSVVGGAIGRWDGNIGNGSKGTTTMGRDVNQKPPYDQASGSEDPPTANATGMGTKGASWPVPVKYTDDRPPEYVLTTPNFSRFVFGQPVSIKLYFAYTDPNVDEGSNPYVTMVYNSPGFPPDLLPTSRPQKLTKDSLKGIVGSAMPYSFGWGRFGLEAEITGTLDAVDPNGQTYLVPTTFNIPPIGLIDSKGRSVYSTTITLTGIPLFGEESVPPEVVIDSPQNYHRIGLGEKVTIEGSASDTSGLSSLTVGSTSVVVVAGQTRTPFAQELMMQEPGCIKIDVTAIDGSLRKNTTTKSVYVVVGDDTEGPSLEVSIPDADTPTYTFSPTFEFSGTASDSGKGDAGVKQVKVGNQIVDKASCEGPDTSNWTHKYTGLTLGANTITIEAEDNLGNKTTVNRTITRHEDSVGPNITVSSPNPLDIYSYGSDHTITGSISDSGYGNNGVKRSVIDGVDLYQPNSTKKAICTEGGSVSFEKKVALAMGYNTYNISAWDDLNNRTEVTIVIRRVAP